MSTVEQVVASTANGAKAGGEPLFSDRARDRIERFAVLCGPLFALCMAVGWLALSQGLEPFAPSLSAEALAAEHQDNELGIILGSTFFLVGCGLLVIWFARHRRDALGPGWLAIYCWVSAAVIALVGLVAFTKTGPFAWNGVLGYHAPFIVWGIPFELLSWAMFTRLKRERAQRRAGLAVGAAA